MTKFTSTSTKTHPPKKCLICGATPIEIHHVASQHLDLTVPLCVEHHREISIRQYAKGIPPESIVERLVTGFCYLADLAGNYGITPIALARLIIPTPADPRINIH